MKMAILYKQSPLPGERKREKEGKGGREGRVKERERGREDIETTQTLK